MNPEDFIENNLTKHQADNPLETMQPGEAVVCVIKRHPIGLLGSYFAAAILIIGALTAAVLVPSYMTLSTSQTKLGLVLGALLLAVSTLIYVYAVTMIYTGNRWIVTTDSITQVAQSGLFATQSSQLSLSDLEDVTVDQKGILQSLMDYGTLRAETAGEHSRFTFIFCPAPNECARKILAARERFPANRTE
jgi:hypothetical protein